MMVKNAIVTYSVLVLLLLLGLAEGFECNNLKRFRCKKGKTAKVNGCTWKKDKFKQYRHFPFKKKLFGICLNAGQSKSQVFGTPTEQCDCGTKCRRKCTIKSGYKKKCYWASRDGSPKGLAGTCLPNRHFAVGGPCPEPAPAVLTNADVNTAVTAWLDNDASNASAFCTYGNITSWNVADVTNMSYMFRDAAAFNWDLSKWNTSKVTSMKGTFSGAAAFNADLSKWTTSEVTTMEEMFSGAAVFNGDLSNWTTSEVTSMKDTFKGAGVFDGDLSEWDTLKVTSMFGTFEDAAVFNTDLSKWNISKVANMQHTFKGAAVFNTDLSEWDTSNVTNMERTFSHAAAFNQNLTTWDTSKVTSMETMFEEAVAFNGDLSKWNIAKVVTARFMLYNAPFNGDLSQWCPQSFSYAANNPTDGISVNYTWPREDWCWTIGCCNCNQTGPLTGPGSAAWIAACN